MGVFHQLFVRSLPSDACPDLISDTTLLSLPAFQEGSDFICKWITLRGYPWRWGNTVRASDCREANWQKAAGICYTNNITANSIISFNFYPSSRKCFVPGPLESDVLPDLFAAFYRSAENQGSSTQCYTQQLHLLVEMTHGMKSLVKRFMPGNHCFVWCYNSDNILIRWYSRSTVL